MVINKRIGFFIIDYSQIGGVERVTSGLIKLFRKNDIPVSHIFSIFAESKQPQLPYPPNLEFNVLGSRKKGIIISKLSKLLIEKNIEVLIFQGDNMSISLAVLEACKQANCKGILQYHGSPYAYLRKYIYRSDIVANPIFLLKIAISKLFYPFKKRKLKKVMDRSQNNLVCVSQGTADELRHIFKLKKDQGRNIVTIYNPVTFLIDDVNKIDFSTKENAIVYVSRLERRHKNALLAIKAWGRVADKYPDWKLWILGDGSIREQMETYVSSKKISNVCFYGMVGNVDEYLQKSKISILTSDCEGLPVGMMESAVYGNALVATKSDGGIIDIVRDGISGLLVPRNGHKELAIALDKLILDHNLRNTMGLSAFEHVQTFSNQSIMDSWIQLLSGIEDL